MASKVTFDSSRNQYKALRDGKLMGYFNTKEQAVRASNVKGVDEPTKGRFRARLGTEYIGTYDSRQDAVKARLAAEVRKKIRG